jgi:hypothetical protein
MKLLKVLLVAALAAPLFAGDLTFTLLPSTETGVLGSTFPFSVVFGGTLIDNDTLNTCDPDFVDCLYLNNITITFDQTATASDFTFLDGIFYNNAAGIFSDDGPGSGGSGLYYSYGVGPIFGIQVDPNTPVGVYTGTVSIEGAIDNSGDTTDILATEPWQLDVVAPEPATSLLTLVGLAAAALLAKRAAA